MAWREFAEKHPDMDVGRVIQGATVTDLPEDVVAAYNAPYPNAASKAGAAQFPLLVPITDDYPGAAEMRAVADALTRWEKPTLVAFSDSDPVFPHPKSGNRFVESMPGATEQVTIEGAAHFLQEDKGGRIADELIKFLAG